MARSGILLLLLFCSCEIAFQIPPTENFRYAARTSDIPSCPSTFRFRGGYDGDEWKVGGQDGEVLQFDDEDSFERKMFEGDDLNNPELDQETFGGDLDSGDTDDAWEDTVQKSLSLRHRNQKLAPRSMEEKPPSDMVAHNRSRWLPDGENTSPSVILRNLVELWEERQRFVERHKATGRQEPVPSLEDLFQEKYPDDVHEMDQCPSQEGPDYDIPPRWSPFPLEGMYGTAYMMRGQHGDVPQKILPNSMWEHDSQYDEGGIEQIWEFDSRPDPPPKGYWDEMGIFHPTFEKSEHKEVKKVLPTQTEVPQAQAPRVEITWSDLVRMTNTEQMESDVVDVHYDYPGQQGFELPAGPAQTASVQGKVAEAAPSSRHRKAVQKKRENAQVRKDAVPSDNEKAAPGVQEKENVKKPAELSSNKAKAMKQKASDKGTAWKKDKANDPINEESSTKTQVASPLSDKSERPAVAPRPAATNFTSSSANAARPVGSLNPFSALNEVETQRNKGSHQSNDSDHEMQRMNETEGAMENTNTAQENLSKSTSDFSQDLASQARFLHKLKRECKRMSVSQLIFFFYDSMIYAPRAFEMAWEEFQEGMSDEAQAMKMSIANFLFHSTTLEQWNCNQRNMIYEARESAYSREQDDEDEKVSHQRHDLNILLWKLSSNSSLVLCSDDLRVVVALVRCILGLDSQNSKKMITDLEDGIRFVQDAALRLLNCYLQFSHVSWSNTENLLRALSMFRALNDISDRLPSVVSNQTSAISQQELQVAVRLAEAELYAFGENDMSKGQAQYSKLLSEGDRAIVHFSHSFFLLKKKKDYKGALEVATSAFRRFRLGMMMTEMFMELLYVHHEEITGEKDPVYDEVAAVLEKRVRGGDNSSFTIGALARISSSAFAIARLEEAVRLRPEDETLWIAKGFIEEWKGGSKDSEEFFLRALALSPRNGFLYARIGVLALNLRANPFSSCSYLELATQHGYKSAEVLSGLVFCKCLGSNAEEVPWEALRKILALDPTEPFTSFALGDLLLYDNQGKEAERLISQALRLSRKKKFQCCLHGLHGQILGEINVDDSGALEEYRKGMELSQGTCEHTVKLLCAHLLKHNCEGSDLKQPVVQQVQAMFEKAFAVNPLHVHLAISFSDFRERVFGDIRGARLIFETVLKNNPNDAWVMYAYANFIDRQEGFSDHCIKLFRDALNVAPNFGVAVSTFALNLHHLTDRKEEAEAAYTRAMELLPSDPDIYSNYAVFLEEKQDYRNAEKVFQKALSLDPNNAETRFMYGAMLHDKLHDVQRARIEYEKLTLLKPNNGKYLCKYGRLLDDADDLPGATMMYEAAVMADPMSLDAIISLANLYFEAHANFDRANVLYERALQINSTHFTALCSYAIMTGVHLRHLNHQSEGDSMQGRSDIEKQKEYLMDKAIRLFEQSYELAPNNLAVCYNYAAFLRENGADFDKAEVFVRKALEIDPHDVSSIYLLAHILREMKGEHLEAMRLYRKATDLDPERLSKMMQIGQFHIDSDVVGEAENLLNSILSSSPHELKENIRWVRTFTPTTNPQAHVPLPFSDAAHQARKELNRRREKRKAKEEEESSWQQKQRERDADAIARELIEEEEMESKKSNKKSAVKKGSRSKH